MTEPERKSSLPTTLEEFYSYFEKNPWISLTDEEHANPGDINLHILSRQARRAGVSIKDFE